MKPRQNILDRPLLLALATVIAVLAAQVRAAERLEYDDAQVPAQPIEFRYSAPDEEYLMRLRSEFGLDQIVAGADGDYQKVRAVSRWVASRWKHNGWNQPSASDPISILRQAAAGKQFRCVEYSIVMSGALNALGIPARVVGLKMKDVETRPVGAGHVVTEAYLREPGKWVMIDGQFDAIAVLRDVPLNAVELQAAIAGGKAGLRIESGSGTRTASYLTWIAPYLHYFDVSLDNRFGVDRQPGKLMLVPIGAAEPKVFQRTNPITGTVYTRSRQLFYQPP